MPSPFLASCRVALAAPCAALALGAALAGCGGAPPALEGSLNDAQSAALDRAWSQRITTLSAPAERAEEEAAALYTACAAMDQGSTLLQAVNATCAPTAVTVKLEAVIPARCAKLSAQCVRAVDRAKSANDTLLAALLQLSDTVKTATDSKNCRAEFTTDAARAQAYRDLSAAYDTVALGVERRDDEIAELGKRRVEEAQARILSRLTTAEQIARFHQACGIKAG